MDSQFHYRKTTNNHPPQSCGLALWAAPPREHIFLLRLQVETQNQLGALLPINSRQQAESTAAKPQSTGPQSSLNRAHPAPQLNEYQKHSIKQALSGFTLDLPRKSH
jgi:hypothetical protein